MTPTRVQQWNYQGMQPECIKMINNWLWTRDQLDSPPLDRLAGGFFSALRAKSNIPSSAAKTWMIGADPVVSGLSAASAT